MQSGRVEMRIPEKLQSKVAPLTGFDVEILFFQVHLNDRKDVFIIIDHKDGIVLHGSTS